MTDDERAVEELIAADAAIPGLAALLRPGAVDAVLEQAFDGMELRRARRHYTRYKPGTSCLCMYEVERSDGALEVVTAKAFSPDNRHKRSKTERAIAAGSPHAALAEPHLELGRLPFDPRLPALARLFDDEARAAMLAEVFPDEPERQQGSVTLLAYKPERRAVTRYVDRTGRAVSLKIHTERRHEDSSRKLIRLASKGPLALPGRVASSSGHGIVVAEWLEGALLADLLCEPSVDLAGIRRVGHALAALQAQDPQHLEIHRPRDQAAAVLGMAETLAVLDGELGRRAAPLATTIATRLAAEPVDAFPVHGDFYAKQVLLDGDAVRFIDLDAAARGSAFEDAACFLAHLDRDVVRGRFDDERAGAVGEALVEGLAEAAPALPGRGLESAHVAALFGLLADPFRRNEEGWLASTHRLLDRVDTLAGRIGSRPAAPARRAAPSGEAPPSGDAKMPWLGPALAPDWAAAAIGDTAMPHARVEVVSAELVRHKPGRRALIDYRLAVDTGAGPAPVRCYGKLRRRRIDYYAYRLACDLQRTGFGPEGAGDVVAPAPLGLVLDLQMWLQRFEPGDDAGDRLVDPDGPKLAARIAEALHRIHAAPLHTVREQTLGDELRILEEQLGGAAEQRPELADRIEVALEAARRVAAHIPPRATTGIHRDFHPHQILVDGERLVLLDFDLFAEGDPLLDAGNFAAHVQELALRTRGAIDGLDEVRGRFEETFLARTPAPDARALDRHRALALLRHVAISQRIEERRAHTAAVLDAAHEQLAALV